MSSWRELWNLEVLGNTLGTWAAAFGIFLATFAFRPLLARLLALHERAPRRAHRGAAAPDAGPGAGAGGQHQPPVPVGRGAYGSPRATSPSPPRVERWLTVALVLLFWMQMALWGDDRGALRDRMRGARRLGTQDTVLSSSIAVIMFGAGIAIWGIAALLALDNLGMQIGPLLAGLGIGGIALALAVQTMLGDFLASLSIALDKPFALGDSLQAG